MPKKKVVTEADRQQEILEGVDAVGTILEEDLGYLRKRLSEIQEDISKIHEEIRGIKLDHHSIESNQQEMMETLKFLTDKLDRIEVRVAENLGSSEFDEAIEPD